MRRALLAADAVGLTLAFVLAVAAVSGRSAFLHQLAVLLLSLPLWIVAAKLNGLYDRDEEQIDHSTIDEVVGVFHLVTLGAWASSSARGSRASRARTWRASSLFWLARDRARDDGARNRARDGSTQRRSTCRTRSSSAPATSASSLARKLLQHPEYGINLVGFVDAHPRARRPELEHVALRRAARASRPRSSPCSTSSA